MVQDALLYDWCLHLLTTTSIKCTPQSHNLVSCLQPNTHLHGQSVTAMWPGVLNAGNHAKGILLAAGLSCLRCCTAVELSAS